QWAPPRSCRSAGPCSCSRRRPPVYFPRVWGWAVTAEPAACPPFPAALQQAPFAAEAEVSSTTAAEQDCPRPATLRLTRCHNNYAFPTLQRFCTKKIGPVRHQGDRRLY